MKKISLLTKIIFHVSNIALIVLYLFPGSIIGWLLYNDFQKQPQISSNLIISFNHFYAFMILSILGVISFNRKGLKTLFIYLFSISIILEICHIIIPKRGFEYSDLIGNFLGVFLVYILFSFYQNFINQ
jgi:VanZ family protein